MLHVDLLVQEKRRVSFMYFCTHENINVFISTDRSSFPNNKISIFTGRPLISSIFNSISMLFLSKLNLLQYNRKCSEHSFSYPHEAEAYHQYGVGSHPPWKLQKGCTQLTTASDKVYQLLSHGRLFSPGTPASSTTKTGRHDIAEILLKKALNTKNQSIMCFPSQNWIL